VANKTIPASGSSDGSPFGEVVDVGPASTRRLPRDRVCGDLSARRLGGFAVNAHQRSCWRRCRAHDVEQAAARRADPLAVQGIAAAGPLRPGQTILINGAGGGVGTIGVQFAKSQMPDVEVTGVDSGIKFETMRRAGFDHVIDYTKEDFTSNGRQYDLIVDTRTTRRSADHCGRSIGTARPSAVRDPELPVPLVGWWCPADHGQDRHARRPETQRDLRT
jgi:NADPH:quinone reductase-like Zn-dependent oxidoreductase